MPKGYREISHTLLKCQGCGAVLLNLVLVRQSGGVRSYRAECPHCPPDGRGNPEASQSVTLAGDVLTGVATARVVDVVSGEDGTSLFYKTERVKS